jgi:hypothetical protein
MENVQIEEQYLARMHEATNVFKDLLTPRERAAAEATWSSIAQDYNGQVKLLDAAKHGDMSAVNYLYLKTLKFTAKVFWRNFLGPNPSAQRRRISQGDDKHFASMIYEMLLDDSPNAVLLQFDPAVFNSNTDLIPKFGWWLAGALKNESLKHNTAEMRGGIAGKVTAPDNGAITPSERRALAHPISYEGHIESGGDDVMNKQEIGRETVVMDAWNTFVEDPDLDAGSAPTARQLLKFFLTRGDFDVNAASEHFEKTNQTIRTKLTGIKPVLEDHEITYEDFGMLIQSQGSELAATLGGLEDPLI